MGATIFSSKIIYRLVAWNWCQGKVGRSKATPVMAPVARMGHARQKSKDGIGGKSLAPVAEANIVVACIANLHKKIIVCYINIQDINLQ